MVNTCNGIVPWTNQIRDPGRPLLESVADRINTKNTHLDLLHLARQTPCLDPPPGHPLAQPATPLPHRAAHPAPVPPPPPPCPAPAILRKHQSSVSLTHVLIIISNILGGRLSPADDDLVPRLRPVHHLRISSSRFQNSSTSVLSLAAIAEHIDARLVVRVHNVVRRDVPFDERLELRHRVSHRRDGEMVIASAHRNISTPHTTHSPPNSGLDKHHASLPRLPALPDLHTFHLLPLRLRPLPILRARILHVLQPRAPPVRFHTRTPRKYAHDHELRWRFPLSYSSEPATETVSDLEGGYSTGNPPPPGAPAYAHVTAPHLLPHLRPPVYPNASQQAKHRQHRPHLSSSFLRFADQRSKERFKMHNISLRCVCSRNNVCGGDR
ncbi:hypothetical protein FIBSPDRAFT_1043398 [Athelia psychrophila]|uniref:Uncharacterized protein n=1 Tax=Athelia psychrophila TaxID=1759441 RepID=A0A166LCT8_9AGAM|nr:hypothetical protein FIBSPDRAFT_1043398 [Fibularhizoctonia sp. CBS 109695]